MFYKFILCTLYIPAGVGEINEIHPVPSYLHPPAYGYMYPYCMYIDTTYLVHNRSTGSALNVPPYVSIEVRESLAKLWPSFG